ncbi:hypothetical protein GCM10027174_45840 [Salinifilum aidingensis]
MPYSTLTALSTAALLRLLAALALYALLHLLRLPLLLAAALLAVSMHRMAAYAARVTGFETASVVLSACPHRARGGDPCDVA